MTSRNPFTFVRSRDGRQEIEKDGIRITADGFRYADGKAWLVNPASAMAYFNTGGCFYSIGNATLRCLTADELYDELRLQYLNFQRLGLQEETLSYS